MRTTLALAGLLAVFVSASMAVEHPILGKQILVKDPTGDPHRRKVIILGKEQPTDIASFADPTVDGATLQVVLSGGTPSAQSIDLPAAGWEAIGNGYKFSRPPELALSTPVLRVLLRRTPSEMARIKIVLKGTAYLQLVPPNPGDDARVILDVHGGDRYCLALGGSAGGSEITDTATQWKVIDATAETTCPATTLPACFSEFSLCGSCGDGICVQHLAGSPDFVCASQSSASAGTCSSSAECTAPRECYPNSSPPCPSGPGQCSLPCQTDFQCEAASAGFCASVTCVGVLCLVPCP